MTFWITTDTHLGHDKIQEYCNRPQDYNEQILEGLEIVRLGDILIHLGDIAFSNKGEKDYMAAIPEGVQKWLIRGNHDRSYSWHINFGWNCVCQEMKIRRYGMVISFSHRPTPTFDCDVQLHGHFHNANPERWEGDLKSYINSRHRLVVLEELNYAPINLEWAINNLKHTQERI